MKRRNGKSETARRPGRRGFTLVELLVAVALVVLMMSMFAEIFTLATDAVSAQKGAAVNDQKVRTFTTLLRTDIESRTFRDVMPFQTVDMMAAGEVDGFNDAFTELSERRKGYFSISENDPDDPTDDVLAFTVDLDSISYGYSNAILYGKAAPRAAAGAYDPANPTDYPPDQPEFDDGTRPPPDGTLGDEQAASTMAEVVYFLRNGNLYRSVMLIREPYSLDPTTGTGTFAENQPSVGGVDLFTLNEPQFWSKYDFSAFRHPVTGVVTFHTVNSFGNTLGTTGLIPMPDGSSVPPSLGIPHLRFGHTINGYAGTGQPDEFAQVATSPVFIGRPLKQELSSVNGAVFYPYPGGNGDLTNDTNDDPDPPPMAAGTYNAATGLVQEYSNTAVRRGAELLVPNVHEFDIQVWDDDPLLGGSMWTDVGANHSVDGSGDGVPDGFYHANKNANTTYCPANRFRFDTWHPMLGGVAPFRPILDPTTTPPRNSPDGQPGKVGVDDDGDASPPNPTGPPDVQPGGSTPDAEEIGWIGSDDEMPLRQIRVRVRFFDVQSGQIRQLTLTLPLTDNSGSL